MSIRIITDAAADITLEELKEWDVDLIPVPLQCGEESYMDDKTIPAETFWNMLLNGATIKTSLPSPDAYLQIFKQAKEAGDDVIYISISSGFSGTFQSAVLAKSMAEYENIWLIDSKCAAAAQKMLVIRACDLRKKGASAKEIAEDLETFRERVHLIACLDTLEYLKRGGRLSSVAANIGTMLRLKPIITFSKEGEILVAKKSRGSKKALQDMIAMATEPQMDPEYPVIPIFAQNDKNCQGYLTALKTEGFQADCKTPEGIGATIGTYIGPGGYGLVYVEK